MTKLHTALQLSNEVVLDVPAEYPHYPPRYFAVFFADPDGVKREYVYSPLDAAPDASLKYSRRRADGRCAACGMLLLTDNQAMCLQQAAGM